MHQVNGYLAPVGDDKGLGEGMRWVMEQEMVGVRFGGDGAEPV